MLKRKIILLMVVVLMTLTGCSKGLKTTDTHYEYIDCSVLEIRDNIEILFFPENLTGEEKDGYMYLNAGHIEILKNGETIGRNR
jgi:hypothetical protein